MKNNRPIKYYDYYKWFHVRAKLAIPKIEKSIFALQERVNEFHGKVEKNVDKLKSEYKFDVNDYDEYKENKYIDGSFLKATKYLFINKKNQYLVVEELLNVYKLASFQQKLNEDEHKLEIEYKKYNLTCTEYREFLKKYYTQVHKELIAEARGYVFSHDIGCLIINRYKLAGKLKKINFRETNKKKAELEAQGKQVWNRTTAEWCKQRGIEYNAEDPRVYLNDDHAYELVLLHCMLKQGYSIQVAAPEQINWKLQHKGYDDILSICKTKDDILNLNLDIKKKLTLYLKRYPEEGIKFIRNESQQLYKHAAASCKNRQ